MAFPNHFEVFHRPLPTSSFAIGDDMGAFHVISLRFSGEITCLFVGVEFSCLLPYFLFVLGPSLLLGVLLSTTKFTAL